MIEEVGIIVFVDKPSLDVESITEGVSSLRLETNEVMCFSVADNVVVTFFIPKVDWTIEVDVVVVDVDVFVSVMRSRSISRIHRHSVYFLGLVQF